MAHFETPPDGELGEYDVDNRLAVGSVWRAAIGLGGGEADIALYGGEGLQVVSNDYTVIGNPLPERSSNGRRIFRLRGNKIGVTLIEAGMLGPLGRWAPGSPWVTLQVQVKESLHRAPAGDRMVLLSGPHLAVNSFDSPVKYQMAHTRTVHAGTSPDAVMGMLTSLGTLRHLVFSCHGQVDYVNGGIVDSVLYVGGQNSPGLGRKNIQLFSQLRSVLSGGVIWCGACAIGSDLELNVQRAKLSGCYVVAPVQYMALTAAQRKRGGVTYPVGQVDMFPRFMPSVFTPEGGKLAFADLLKKRELGIRT
jgi:hypothetical protein